MVRALASHPFSFNLELSPRWNLAVVIVSRCDKTAAVK